MTVLFFVAIILLLCIIALLVPIACQAMSEKREDSKKEVLSLASLHYSQLMNPQQSQIKIPFDGQKPNTHESRASRVVAREETGVSASVSSLDTPTDSTSSLPTLRSRQASPRFQ